ncbi:MAG TPA: GNAT family N-acetyltransferase [Gaiellaceae bacterium]|jgi:phosphinothricin acetyltransferase
MLIAVDVMIRDLEPLDWPEVARIFEDGIRSGNATFELEPPAWEAWDAAHSQIRVVAELEGRVVGWAAVSPKSARHCYRGVAESSVYVEEAAQGRGVGRALMDELISRTETAGLWTLEAGIFPENKASLRLHLGCGFRLVGVRERLGEATGEFRDVLLLERRSEVIGQ